MVEKIVKEKFDELISGDTPVVCDSYASWCGPRSEERRVGKECM